MKAKFLFAIVFALGALVGVVTDNYEITGTAAIGFCVAVASTAKSGLAFVTLVPSVQYDIRGNIVAPLTRAQKALYDFLNMKSNPITKGALNAADLVFDPVTYYIRYDITGLSGRQTILDQSTIKQVGVTNFDKGVLQQYYNFAFDRVVVRYANVTSADASPAASAAYSSVRSSMPAALANAEIIVMVNEANIIQTSVMDFTSAASITGGGARDFDGGELQVPKIFPENLNLQVDINFAFGQTVPSAANNTYLVEVAFEGVQARLR